MRLNRGTVHTTTLHESVLVMNILGHSLWLWNRVLLKKLKEKVWEAIHEVNFNVASPQSTAKNTRTELKVGILIFRIQTTSWLVFYLLGGLEYEVVEGRLLHMGLKSFQIRFVIHRHL